MLVSEMTAVDIEAATEYALSGNRGYGASSSLPVLFCALPYHSQNPPALDQVETSTVGVSSRISGRMTLAGY